MRLRFKSWTLWFNLFLIGAGIFGPSLHKDTRNLLIINGIAGLGLRAKTKEPLIEKEKKK